MTPPAMVPERRYGASRSYRASWRRLALVLTLAVVPGLAAARTARAQDAKQTPKPAQAEAPKAAPQEKGEKTPLPPASEKKAAPSAEAQKPGELPPGVVARLNGREITIQDYTAYLFASLGKSKLREYIDRLLLEEEGKRLQVEITPEEVEERVTGQIESALRALYKNNMESFIENLGKRGLTLEEHKQKLRQDTAYRLLEDKCILKTRKVEDEDVQARFEQTYGPGGVQYEIRHVLISTHPRPRNAGDPRPPAISEQEARAKAEKALKEIQGGADFVQMVRTNSDDELTRRNDGRIPQYRKGYRGQEFHDAVVRLTEQNRLSDVVKSPQGYHIIQLIEKKTTRLEDKREELKNLLTTQQPTPQERNAFVKGLRDKAKIEM